MSTDRTRDAVRQSRRADLLRNDGEMTDGQLLERFVTCRDEAAFEALVRRHGPMVLGVCRRVLHHAQDAEDAFQAAFLVLVRKAASIGQRELLGNWLYGVAYRTALDARAAAIRRRKRERQVQPMPEPQTTDSSDACRDLRPLLDQELNCLPDKYRMPIVLCDLEGRTYREVAQQLGIAAGTLSGRLTTARKMLAKRLTRHGLALSSGALIAALSPSTASAAVPPLLVTTTVEAATKGAFTSQAAALAAGVLKAMLLTKLKIATVMLLTLLVGAAAVAVQAYRGDSEPGAARVFDLGMDQRGRQVAWSPDGKTLIVVTEAQKTFFGLKYAQRGSPIRLWDVEKGQVKQTLAENPDKNLSFFEAIFSADGKTIAAMVQEPKKVILPNGEVREGASRRSVKIWDAKTFVLKQTLVNSQSIFCFALSPDGKWVTIGTYGKKMIELWNAGTGKLERTLETGEAWPRTLEFSPDSKRLIVGCHFADRSGEVQLWDVQTWKLKQVLKHDKYVNTIALSSNGNMLATGSGDGSDRIQIWDLQKGKPILSLKGIAPGTRCAAFSPDGRTIATGWIDGQVRLWDVQTGELKESLRGHGSEIYSLAFSPDGKTLASVSQDETLRLWPINKGTGRAK